MIKSARDVPENCSDLTSDLDLQLGLGSTQSSTIFHYGVFQSVKSDQICVSNFRGIAEKRPFEPSTMTDGANPSGCKVDTCMITSLSAL